MYFEIPGDFRLTRRLPADPVSLRAAQFAVLFGMNPLSESACVSTLAENGHRILSGDFEVLYADHRGLIVVANNCDLTYADSIEDAVERYLGLHSKIMRAPPESIAK